MPQSKRVTIGDIAKRAGVSVGAVSFALNGQPGVSEDTRARIRAIAAELEWHPHSAARALSGSRAGVIGFVLNRPARTLGTETFFPELISGIQMGISGSHTALHMLIARDLDDEISTYRELWYGQRVDGVIVIDPREHDPRPQALATLGMPAVLVGSRPSAPGLPATVWIDDGDAAKTIFDYVQALGHRRVAHVAGRAEFEHTAMRADALQECRVQHGLEWAESITTDYSAEQAASVTRQLLSRADRPTAIVYDNDVMSVSGLGVAQEMGVSVPGDVSMVSFDDSDMARLVRPGLTTLTRDTFELGEIAARTLLAQIASDTIVPSVPGPLPRLTVRGSTGPPQRTRAAGASTYGPR
jgi:DNA-binding LacI/PurR family transcriptional regulator